MSDQPDIDAHRQFVVCPACGRLTPGNTVRCVECGEPMAALVAEYVERANERRFAEALFGRMTPATWTIIGANVLVFVLMTVAAGALGPGDFRYQATLVNFGAKVNTLVDAGQYWRLVTPIFIHIGLPHLFVNMYSLYIIGPHVERLYGTSRYLVLYMVCGFGGVIGSYVGGRFMAGDDVPSAGASGALFGLLGILLVFGLRHRSELPGVFKQAFSPRAFVPVLVLNLVITFAVPMIDKGAHVGGLLAGCALAWIVPFARATERTAGFAWWTAAALSVAAVVASFGMAWRAAEPIPDVNRFIQTYNASGKSLDAASSALVAAAAGSAVSPALADELRAAAGNAGSDAGVDQRSRELLAERTALLERAATLLTTGRDQLTPEAADAFEQDVSRHARAWDDWLAQSGPRFAIVKNTEDSTSSGGNDGN